MSRAIVAHQAFVDGDLAAVRRILGDPCDFPNVRPPVSMGIGDNLLEYAIYWSPLPFVDALLSQGAEVNYGDDTGFPSIIAALSTTREDLDDLLRLLLVNGADVDRRGVNDWTPLHMAVAHQHAGAISILLEFGADRELRTRIDDRTTALEDAETLGWQAGIDLLRSKDVR